MSQIGIWIQYVFIATYNGEFPQLSKFCIIKIMTANVIRNITAGIACFSLFLLLSSWQRCTVPTSVHAEDLLLSETFDNGIPTEWKPFLNYWRLNDQQWYGQDGKILFDPARGVADPNDGAHDGLFMYDGGALWKNYTINADVTGLFSGIWFRGEQRDASISGQWVTGYYFYVTARELRLDKLMTQENCTRYCGRPEYLHHFSNPTSIGRATFSTDENTPHHVEITASGSEITVSVDGTQYFNVQDSDFTQGTVGFVTYKKTASFDNIRVVGSIVHDTTPPICNIQNTAELKTFEKIPPYLQGFRSVDNESYIVSGNWTIVNSSGQVVERIGTIDGFAPPLPVGRYRATLTVTNGAGLTNQCTQNIGVYSVSGFKGSVSVNVTANYTIPSYSGALHADNNPGRAVIVSWPGRDARFVFWHEASYVPFWEFPNGSGANYQFFEGANGSGELFNMYGRMDKNSNVEIVENSSKMIIVKWWYYDVNKDTGARVGYAEEFFYFFPNGLVLRQMELKSGHSFEPMEVMIINPANTYWWDNVPKEGSSYHVSAAIDIYSGEKRDHWGIPTDNINKAFYNGTGADIRAIEDAEGVLFRSYLKNYPDVFVAYGTNSLVTRGDIIELGEWEYPHFVHWPIGWMNSEWKTATEEEVRTYPTHTSTLGTNIDGNGPYYWLLGVSDAPDSDLISISKEWLSSPFYVPCSPSECTIAQLPPESDIPDPLEDRSSWYYDNAQHLCSNASSYGRIACSINARPVTLKAGWNFIAMPTDLARTDTYWFINQTSEIDAEIGNVTLWTDRHRFEGTISEGGELYGNPVEILSSTPIFAHVAKTTTLEELPYPVSINVPPTISLTAGWNSVVLRSQHVGIGVKSSAFLKDTILDLIQGDTYSKRTISYFDAQSQRWVTHILDNGALYGNDFTLIPGSAYFIWVGE